MNSEFLKSRNFLIGAVTLVVVLLVGAFFLFKGSTPKVAVNQEAQTEAPIPTITQEDLGLKLEAGPGKRTVILTIEKTQGISAIEYELSYTAKDDIPRGALGKVNLKRQPAREEITLGTCSDVCHYDTDISNIKIVLKITKIDGSVFQSTATLKDF